MASENMCLEKTRYVATYMPGFLKLLLSGKSICVRVCPPPWLLRNHSRDNDKSYYTAFQFLYMTLAINIVDGRRLSNKEHRELLPKKNKLHK